MPVARFAGRVAVAKSGSLGAASGFIRLVGFNGIETISGYL